MGQGSMDRCLSVLDRPLFDRGLSLWDRGLYRGLSLRDRPLYRPLSALDRGL